MQAEESNLTFEEAAFTVTGTERQITLAEIARGAADGSGEARPPEGGADPIEGSYLAKEAPLTFTNDRYICELLVNPETGVVDIQNYSVVDDFGRVVNPLPCVGQVHGATVRGIGACSLHGIAAYVIFRIPPNCPLWVCAVVRRRFPVGARPTRPPLQPEATGAVMEVTKWLKPSGSVSRIGEPRLPLWVKKRPTAPPS